MDETKIRKRIADSQEYIDGLKLLYKSATTEEIKNRSLNYWGFAMMIKELFELHLTKSVAMTQEEINKEKEREETTDWMTRWLKDLAKVAKEKP